MSEDPSHIRVLLANEQTVEVDEDRISDVAKRTAVAEEVTGELSVLIVDAARMSELVREFLGEEGPTDVLAFPIDAPGEASPGPGAVLLGEVVICPEVAAGQAVGGLDEELDLLTAHGVLHLVGHDHDTEEAASRMREREKAVTGRSGARAS